MPTQANIANALDEIRKRELRGATLVTKLALNAMAKAIVGSKAKEPRALLKELTEYGSLFTKVRPTAIVLSNGVRQVLRRAQLAADEHKDIEEVKAAARKEAEAFIRGIDDSIHLIADIGVRRLSKNDVVLTHGYSSSVLAIMRKAHQEGKAIRAMVTESRPEFEGRIVARALVKEGIPTTMIIDSAVSHFIKDVNKVMVGAEAVAANGAVVNKVGTSTIASVAHESRVRVFVAASLLKFSPETILGELIEIEERDPRLVVPKNDSKGLERVAIRNPAFDVTAPEYIDLIITERGVIPPQAAIMVLRQQTETPPFLLEG